MSDLMVYYIDDQSTDHARRYKERLDRAEGFECKLLPPPEMAQLDELAAATPDLFLVDYELNLVQEDGTKSPYQGSTLAAAIRERLPDCPIVLITRETILAHLDHQRRRQLVGHTQAYDEMILKESLDDALEDTRQQLISIAEGFKQLSQTESKTWASLVSALNATESEAADLREASPPLERAEWIITGAAHWIRKIVLEFPGILYDSLNAATRLGISEESFLRREVQEVLASAKYTGVFEISHNRWWKGRLFKIAQDMAAQSGIRGPINRTFIQACEKTLGADLEPSICVWDHQPVADWVCYILQKPVKIRHTFRYYPDNRPSVMDNARVSFRAMRESRQFYPDLLDAEGELREVEALPEP